MKCNLLITSINPGVGKTTFTLALALKLKSKGYKIGYFKPISDNYDDTDSEDAKELLQMEEDVKTICPTTVTPYEYDMPDEQVEQVKNAIMSAYNRIRPNYDFLIIEVSRKAAYLAYLNLSAKYLAKMLDAKVLILTEGRDVEDADRFIFGLNYFNAADVEVIGGIMTLVPYEILEHFKTVVVPRLEKVHKLSILGLVPNQGPLAAPTVQEICSKLDAKVLAGRDYLDNLVENYQIGAMSPEIALKYMRRVTQKAVITGGDRPQMALAALETDTSVIILTGSILPPAAVLSKAEEKGVPILLTASDTYSTIRSLTDQPIYGKLYLKQTEKIKAWNEILETVNYKKILELLEKDN